MARDPILKQFIERLEGREVTVYKDENGIPTVGIGSNLKSPEVPAILRRMGLNPKKILSGKQQLSQKQIDYLYMRQMAEKELYFIKIAQKDFPSADIKLNERRALLSLMFNSPALIGPRMRKFLEENNDEKVVHEIILNSNRSKSPGLQKRRIEEAKQYSGHKFKYYFNKLSKEEKKQVYNIYPGLENEL
jgi:GH24 family phage-related lysozyme (muramidase)